VPDANLGVLHALEPLAYMVLWPERDGQLSAFMQQMTNLHVKRWKEHRREVGYGHRYQGRFLPRFDGCHLYFFLTHAFQHRATLFGVEARR
jgi:hypothetical protein